MLGVGSSDQVPIIRLEGILREAVLLSDGLTIGEREDAHFLVYFPRVGYYSGDRLLFGMELYAFKSASSRESTLIYRTDLHCRYRAMFDCGLSALKLIERAIARAPTPPGQTTGRSSSLAMTR